MFFIRSMSRISSTEYTDIYYIEGISSSVTLSPTLVDPAHVSVIRVVDGQDTGLSAQPAEKEEPTSDRHRPGLSSSERTGPGADFTKGLSPVSGSNLRLLPQIIGIIYLSPWA